MPAPTASARRPFRRVAAALGVALSATLVIGCSADRHTYRSTPTAPKSVAVTYVQSGDTAWSYDIPVNQALTIEFDREGQFNGFNAPNTPATEMSWYTTDLAAGRSLDGNPSKNKSNQSGTVALSGQPVQIEVSVRDASAVATELQPLDAVPAPPAVEEPEEVPAPPAVEEPAVEDAMEAAEEAADDAATAAEDAEAAVEDAAEAVEEAAEDVAPAMDK